MAGGTFAYVGRIFIDEAYRGKNVNQAMLTLALSEGKKRGVSKVIGFIPQRAEHDRAAVNALKACMGSDGLAYTYVYGDVLRMASELGV
jgi:GNAT superfamily N-acetyltransferase